MEVKFTDLSSRLGRLLRPVVSIVLYLWQLPQNLLGLLLVEALTPERTVDYKDVLVHYAAGMKGGISLGRHIVLAKHFQNYNGKTEAHEYGHTRQSLMLGPLYLLVVGLPSLIWACWWNEKRGVSYYKFFTEKWADILGGVTR
jgi:hypothetical protein